MTEEQLQVKCNQWISATYPELDRLFWFNSLQSVRLSFGTIRKMKASGGLKKNLLDFQLLKNNGKYCGLLLELKKESPYKRDGKLVSNEHYQNQADTMELLRTENYYADFVWTFEQFRDIVTRYMDGNL